MALSESATKQLEALYQKYRESLPEKIALVKEAFDKSVSQNYSTDPVKELQFIVHNLAGSAAMHGFNEVSSCARVIDRHIGRDALADTSDQTWQQDLQNQFDKLSDAIAIAVEEQNSVPA
ncbi:MAG: Hpt domain-containing protein [Gammaproteobacteria bacterium]|nr:Hpt domain-containing protein [Gammaproteobacteria bacterium]